MSPSHLATSHPTTQRGSMLVIALFIIVIMAILGLAMLKMMSASAQSVVFEVYGQRALNAARSGVEQRLAAAFPIADPAIPGSGNPQCLSNVRHTFTGTDGLQNCEFISSCQQIPIRDGVNSYDYYRFSSTGTCTAAEVVVSRTVSIDAIEL